MKQEILSILKKYSHNEYDYADGFHLSIPEREYETVADEIIVLMEAEITRKDFDNPTVSKMELTQ